VRHERHEVVAHLQRVLRLLLEELAIGRVVRDRVNQLLVELRRGRPAQPAVRAVFAAVPVLEERDLLVLGELGDRGLRRLAIFVVHQIDERLRHQPGRRVAEDAMPRLVDAREVAVEVRDAEQIARHREEPFELLLRACGRQTRPAAGRGPRTPSASPGRARGRSR
jgi:hypothetical protein